MDEINDKNILNTLDYAEKGIKGFKEGNPGKPKGAKNKFSLAKLEEAIEAEEEIANSEGDVGIFQKFIRMAYTNPAVMIALMKKFIPDKSSTELSGGEKEWTFNIKRADDNK